MAPPTAQISPTERRLSAPRTIGRRCGRGVTSAAVALLGLASACTYAPEPPSGKLICGVGASCPDGYQCLTPSNRCWKNGEEPDGSAGGKAGSAGGGAGGSGAGGAGGKGGPYEQFLGHWVFSATATRKVQCTDDNTLQTYSLANDFVDVSTGSSAPLEAFYYCTWELQVSGNSTVIVAGQSCTGNPDEHGTVYTWHGMQFTFSLGATALTANLNAALPADFKKADKSTGTCTVLLSGDLVKDTTH